MNSTPPISACCQQPMRVVSGGEGTSHYVCLYCSKPADPYTHPTTPDTNLDARRCKNCGEPKYYTTPGLCKISEKTGMRMRHNFPKATPPTPNSDTTPITEAEIIDAVLLWANFRKPGQYKKMQALIHKREVLAREDEHTYIKWQPNENMFIEKQADRIAELTKSIEEEK